MWTACIPNVHASWWTSLKFQGGGSLNSEIPCLGGSAGIGKRVPCMVRSIASWTLVTQDPSHVTENIPLPTTSFATGKRISEYTNETLHFVMIKKFMPLYCYIRNYSCNKKRLLSLQTTWTFSREFSSSIKASCHSILSIITLKIRKNNGIFDSLNTAVVFLSDKYDQFTFMLF